MLDSPSSPLRPWPRRTPAFGPPISYDLADTSRWFRPDLETVVPASAKRPRLDELQSLGALVAQLNHLGIKLDPGTIIGAGVYVHSREVVPALVAWILWRPAVAASHVLAEWIKLLAPPRRWRRPRRRGG